MTIRDHKAMQKLRGGYYTPPDIADFLVRWVSSADPETVLEPSCGDGVFFAPISEHIPDTTITSFEIDQQEAQKAVTRAAASSLSDVAVHAEDFIGWALRQLQSLPSFIDAVVGNPPFIRYQSLAAEFQSSCQAVFRILDCPTTKHVNAWVAFVLASFALLAPGGRLAVVVPSELLHITYARSLRRYLLANATKVVIINPTELWFPDTIQGAVLMLAEKKRFNHEHGQGVAIEPVSGRAFLNGNPDELFESAIPVSPTSVSDKWTPALLSSPIRALVTSLADHPSISAFRCLADVDVGIVTGANNFFLVSDATVREFGLEHWAHPMFGRSQHCPGVIYDERQHAANATKGLPTNFVWFTSSDVTEHPGARAYIAFGESQRLDLRYKCRVRNPWYAVPSVYSTGVGMPKRAHEAPRLILNRLNAYTTDTTYRIQVKGNDPARFVASFLNPLTALSAELEGRHYGGGVLELVPSEIERLLVPATPSEWSDIGALDGE